MPPLPIPNRRGCSPVGPERRRTARWGLMPAGGLELGLVFGLKILRRPRLAVRESIVAKFGSVVQWVVIVSLSGTAAAAQAQNIDAGKSPAQIFSDTCGACHRSPREIKQ